MTVLVVTAALAVVALLRGAGAITFASDALPATVSSGRGLPFRRG